MVLHQIHNITCRKLTDFNAAEIMVGGPCPENKCAAQRGNRFLRWLYELLPQMRLVPLPAFQIHQRIRAGPSNTRPSQYLEDIRREPRNQVFDVQLIGLATTCLKPQNFQPQ
jgi:hypothetical protein